MEQIVVGVADCGVGSLPDQLLVTYALGSCVAVAVYDPKVRVGGLLHFMLPDSGLDSARARENPCMFADTGISVLLEKIGLHGANHRHASVHLIGGAQIMSGNDFFEIGKRNGLAARRILWKAGILLSGEALGGAQSRTVRLEVGTGRVLVQEGRGESEISRPLRKGGGIWPTGF